MSKKLLPEQAIVIILERLPANSVNSSLEKTLFIINLGVFKYLSISALIPLVVPPVI
ncbi:hypothetical protein D3C76_1737510 [compost metagenome]